MPRSTYTPPEDAAKIFSRYKRALETQAELKEPMIEFAKRELHAGASVGDLARETGLTAEFFRRIARAEGIALKRAPTVRRLSDDD